MLQASSAKIAWDPNKHWHVEVHVGTEVINRSLPKLAQDAADEELRSQAVATAKDEGYTLDPARVEIVR